MKKLVTPKPVVSQVSLDVVSNTITKIREQFYEFTNFESQFYTYDEKSDEAFDFVYED